MRACLLDHDSPYRAGLFSSALLFTHLVLSLLKNGLKDAHCCNARVLGEGEIVRVDRICKVSKDPLCRIFGELHVDHLSSLHVRTSWVSLM